MTKTLYEKNRYLRLDGSPIEQGAIRRTIAPRGLSLYFLVAVGCTADVTNLEDVGLFIPAVVVTGVSVIQRRALNIAFNASWEMDFHRYAVDTRPSPCTKHNPPDFYASRAIFTTAITGITGIGCLLNGGDEAAASYLEGLKESLDINFALQFPTLHLAYQQGYTYHQVKTGKWKIVKMTDMEPAKETSSSPAHLPLTPTMSPA